MCKGNFPERGKSRHKERMQHVLVHYLKASMSGAEHMRGEVGKAEAEEMGRGQHLPSLTHLW